MTQLAHAARAAGGAILLSAALLGTGTATAHADGGSAVMGGGSGIIIDNLYECTLTTIGYDGAGRLVGLTAGHCGDPGSTVWAEQARGVGPIGKFVHSDHDLDYAVIQFDPNRVTPVNRIGNTTITNVGQAASFPQVACKEGRTTGNTCGIVYGDLFGDQSIWTQMCVVEGDSGAPVVVGNTLVGMVNAYLLVACAGPEVGTNMGIIMGDINGRGDVGAGFAPV
ncbi:S1 family peptidase [Nocardia stercoris]